MLLKHRAFIIHANHLAMINDFFFISHGPITDMENCYNTVKTKVRHYLNQANKANQNT